jgi:hypothetical protein
MLLSAASRLHGALCLTAVRQPLPLPPLRLLLLDLALLQQAIPCTPHCDTLPTESATFDRSSACLM